MAHCSHSVRTIQFASLIEFINMIQLLFFRHNYLKTDYDYSVDLVPVDPGIFNGHDYVISNSRNNAPTRFFSVSHLALVHLTVTSEHWF